MFAKRLLKKAIQQHHNHDHPSPPSPKSNVQGMPSRYFDFQIAFHYGIPLTASILAFDPIQRLLAIGTLDGRIKIIGGSNIEGLLISPKRLPYKNLEFFCNEGFLVGLSNDNDLQVWGLEVRNLRCSLQWECNITAFSVIKGTFLMYIGDEQGSISVLKYDDEEGKIMHLPYHITLEVLSEAAGIFLPPLLSVVGILSQPLTSGSRLLIAYVNGLIILWDVTKDKVVDLKGYSNLHLKDAENANISRASKNQSEGSILDKEQDEKEICSLCWVSSSGNVLAVGYTDGDILLWNISSNSHSRSQQDVKQSDDVVKLQLSSESRRLPVIILHWAPNIKQHNGHGGQLFVYGGDEIGSEEVLTVLSLDRPSGVDALTCVDRMDLTLNGSFADMMLIPKSGISEDSSIDAVFVLSNPGQLHVYESSLLFNFKLQEKGTFIKPKEFPVAVPTVDPSISLAKHYLLPMSWNNLKALLERVSSKDGVPSVLPAGKNWPVTGGVPCMFTSAEETGFERIYIAGYQDGSVRIWDATSPILTPMYIMEREVKGMEVAFGSSCVSAMDFCSKSHDLAIGCESGLVRIYKIHESPGESIFHFLSEKKHEVDVVLHKDNVHCTAVVFLLSSPIQTLKFACSGSRLAIGYKSGQVIMLELNSMCLLVNSNDFSGTTSSEIVSFTTTVLSHNLKNSTKQSKLQDLNVPYEEQEVLFILSHDAHIAVIDGFTGNMIVPKTSFASKESIAVSIHIIGVDSAFQDENSDSSSQKKSPHDECTEANPPSGVGNTGVEKNLSVDTSRVGGSLSDSYVLLCCEDSLILYLLNSVVQGKGNYIHKVKLVKPCCWSTTFKLKNGKDYVVLLLYQAGDIEIRSLPNLEIVAENTLMSILRWPFKVNMEKTLGASENGEISLVHGCEMAFVSFFSSGNDTRILDSLPCLHNKMLAEAAKAAIRASNLHKKQQSPHSNVLGGIIKGLKGFQEEQVVKFSENMSQSTILQQLEKHFSRILSKDPAVTVDAEDAELSIDDIEIDDPLPIASTSHSEKHNRKVADDKKQREKLFEDSKIDVKPRPRTHEEILTKYKFGGDASAAAAYAKDKLIQRQEKLQRINERTEELQNRAEDFKSMADELVKTMENRKWWKL